MPKTLFLLLFLLASGLLCAQQTVSGTVKNDQGEVLVGVTVQEKNTWSWITTNAVPPVASGLS